MDHPIIFLSDTHLLSKKCVDYMLLQFVSEIKPKQLFLLGDIEDFWRLQHGKAKTSESFDNHIKIHHKFFKLLKNGCETVWILGNHDELVWKLFGNHEFNAGNLKIREKEIITLSSGQRCLLIHGHQFEFVTLYMPKLAWIGDIGYHFLIWLNKQFNWARAKLGFPYWSLSKYVKVKIKNYTNLIGKFEQIAAKYAKEMGCDIVICGHVHDPQIKLINGVWYVNLGCWTDISNCTYAIEHNGNIELWNYSNKQFIGKTEEIKHGS